MLHSQTTEKIVKFIFTLITGVLFLTFATIPATLFSQEEQTDEMRAVCLHDYMFSSEKAVAIPEITNLLDKYIPIKINNIVCFFDLSGQPRDYDFLEVLLEEAHKRGMKVHPIIHPGYRVKLEGEIKQYPEWLIMGRKGEIYPNLNLANKEARDYILRKVSDVLKNYDVDGIRLDYIRFQLHNGFSYDKANCEAFKTKFGKSPLEVKDDCGSIIWCEWIKWNAEHVTTLVREVKNLIQESGKDISLSVDVFPNLDAAKVEIAQDWGKWAEEGIVDVLCPMIYTNNLDVFRNCVKEAVIIANGKCLVYPTIGCITSHNKNTPEGVVESVEISREEGADGIYFFSAYSFSDEIIEKLKSTVFK